MESTQHEISVRPGVAEALPLRSEDPALSARVDRLLETARSGLAQAYVPAEQHFAHTVRVAADGAAEARPEGRNLRYAAISCLGLARSEVAQQEAVLSGARATDVVARTAARAQSSADPGAVALAAWAVAEVSHQHPTRLLARLDRMIGEGSPLSTVELAWAITAMTAVRLEGVHSLFEIAVKRLLAAHGGGHGIFPHYAPADSQAPWRAHVGSFADQVYPVQALARAHAVTGDSELLQAANRTAAQICELQGPAGQWWWHYDTRTGGVVERYPVYSVHQHAMAPMVLADLAQAGGDDHSREVAGGLGWLHHPPETAEQMISERFGLIWRKVGRREPRKAARAARAASTWVAPHRGTPGLDRLLPPTAVDHECRPYELGWLLYTWEPLRGHDD